MNGTSKFLQKNSLITNTDWDDDDPNVAAEDTVYSPPNIKAKDSKVSGKATSSFVDIPNVGANNSNKAPETAPASAVRQRGTFG